MKKKREKGNGKIKEKEREKGKIETNIGRQNRKMRERKKNDKMFL